MFQFPLGSISVGDSCGQTEFLDFSNTSTVNANIELELDFGNPGLQPPATAPWTLSFGPYGSSSFGPGYQQTQGTVTLNGGPSTSDTIVNLSYVIQPQQSLLTLPGEQVCPGNTTSFIPGANVVNNGSPAFSVTIPAGQTQASFILNLQTFNSDTYNVQVVAWQPAGNLQSAWCLTVPNTAPSLTSQVR